MPKTAPLWDSGARKEAFELLEHLWFERGDHQIRARLAEALANGPPEHLGEHEDSTESERQALRDRRIFDRIGVLLRGNQAVLPAELNAIYAAIMARHPEWQPPEDEKARFHIWVEPWEPDTLRTPSTIFGTSSIPSPFCIFYALNKSTARVYWRAGVS